MIGVVKQNRPEFVWVRVEVDQQTPVLQGTTAEIHGVGFTGGAPRAKEGFALTCRFSSNSRSGVDASLKLPTFRQPTFSPVSASNRSYSSELYIIILVRLTDERSSPTRPAE